MGSAAPWPRGMSAASRSCVSRRVIWRCRSWRRSGMPARRIALPRDSDQQFGQGKEVAMSADGAGYEAGDLLFFAERGRVSHVALWAGAGRIVHAALSRGGGGGDDLFGPEPRMVRLRENLVGVRRP